MIAERERRKKERGKKRYEEDYSFVNEEFFSSWQNRTNNHKNTGSEGTSIEKMFDGGSITVDVEVTFSEVMQEGGVSKDVTVERQEACPACKGSRERAGSESLACYSCKGEGVKEDALFHKQVKCNTCKGYGKLIKNECGSC